MPSPFPGMDLYLEQRVLWPNVHNSLIAALRDDLARGCVLATSSPSKSGRTSTTPADWLSPAGLMSPSCGSRNR